MVLHFSNNVKADYSHMKANEVINPKSDCQDLFTHLQETLVCV